MTAIERVDVGGAKERQLTVVLTGDEPMAYHLRCRSASAVHEFAQAGWQVLREPWMLRARGITVEGELHGTHWHEGGKQYSYAYVDSHGVRRDRKSPDALRTPCCEGTASPSASAICEVRD